MFGLSEPAAIFYFLVTLVQLVAVVIWVDISAFSLRLDISTLGWTPRLDGALDVSSRWCIGRLVSTVHWTSRLDGALDILSRRCIGHLVYDVARH